MEKSKRGSKLKGGQMQLSFGMIFSIILIIAFIAFSIYAIKKFLDFQNFIKIEQFADDLQKDIDDMWKSSQGSYEAEYSLPTKVNAVCFKIPIPEDDYENLYFDSERIIPGKKIEHVNINKTLDAAGEEEFVCFENIKGKVKMILQKDYDEVLVTISQVSE